MKWRRFFAVARKEFIHVRRDPRSVIMAIAIPVMLLLLFGYTLTLDVDRVPLVVWDQSDSPVSRDLVSRFDFSKYFAIIRFAHNDHEAFGPVDEHTALAVLVIPRDFATAIERTDQVPVQLVVDGSDPQTAQLAINYAEAITGSFSQQHRLARLSHNGRKPPSLPVDMQTRFWFNPELRSRNALVPGLIALVMVIIAAFLTSLTVAREWESGSMEQLIATPVRGPELILGKLVPYLLIGIFNTALAVAMSYFVFHVPLRGNLFVIAGVALVFLVGAMSLGILISVVTKSQLLASQAALMGTFLPTFMLSGLVFSIANMPAWLQALTWLVIARYFVTLQRAMYLKGAGPAEFPLEALALLAFAILLCTMAIVRFRKRLD
ncbi:MAG: ABC transporter permease [Planctomycetota bacterium]